MMPKRKNGNKLLILIFALLLFGTGFYFGGNYNIVQPPEDIDFSLFWETYYDLKDNFLGFDNVDDNELVYGAVRGMITTLDDPYTVFFDPEQTEKFYNDISGKFEGVGMEVGVRDDNIIVISPITGTPAFNIGMHPGDEIISIDGKSTKGMSIEEAVNLIRGPKGTSVKLKFIRKEREHTVTIVRDVINIPSVSWEMIGDDIFHIKLHHFHQGMIGDFSEIVNAVVESSAKGIILDVRNNPGGSLNIVNSISGWFLEKDDTIVVSYERGVEKDYNASGNPILASYPTVALINEGSASASEIIVAALRENRDVTVIGERSFGKGSIQSLHRLSGGSSIKITVSEWFTPLGNAINGVGVSPDVEVELTMEDIEEGKDPQLDKAVEVLIEKIK